MSELKATPGPYFRDCNADMAFGVYAVVNGERKNIVNWQGLARPYSDGQANAHLLAASWEMYDALKAITDCYGSGLSVDKFIEVVDDFMMEGRAALSKARGEKT